MVLLPIAVSCGSRDGNRASQVLQPACGTRREEDIACLTALCNMWPEVPFEWVASSQEILPGKVAFPQIHLQLAGILLMKIASI